MSDIPDFDTAVALFQQFLAEQGRWSQIFWVFRDDIWRRSSDVVLRFPSHERNLILVKKVFEEGRRKGLVSVHAIATVGEKVAATVWFPKFTDEEIQGWNRGLKLTIAKPLPKARIVGEIRWFAMGLQPKFRDYQRLELCVGTKAWARSQSVEDI